MRKTFSRFLNKVFQRRSDHPNDQRIATSKTSPALAEYGPKLGYEGDKPTVDIVAIHGLGGSWKISWTDPVTGCFWLQDLLPTIIPDIRVLSYGYEASRSSITTAQEGASVLLTDLAHIRSNTNSDDRPVIFLAHSYGGPLLKGALAMSHEAGLASTGRTIKSSTYGILFLGVPRNAEHGFSSLTAVALNEDDDPSESPLMKTLKQDLRWLQKSNSKYSQICNEFSTVYFTESADGVSGVQDQSNSIKAIDAAKVANTDTIRLSKIHDQMIRFPSAGDSDFLKVSHCLAAMVVEAEKSRCKVIEEVPSQNPETC